VTVGLAVLSKLSSLMFLPVAAVVWLCWEGWCVRRSRAELARGARDAAMLLAIAIPVACLIAWAGYRFSFGLVRWWNIRLPAHELFEGIKAIVDHQAAGHNTYLFGRQISAGWWLYYPSVIALKTPVAFLMLLAV
jgi:hypothetical protein